MPTKRFDNEKFGRIIESLNNKISDLGIEAINNNNISRSDIGRKGFHLNTKGTNTNLRISLYLSYLVFNIDDTIDGQAQYLQLIENVSEVDPYPTLSKESTVSHRPLIHQHIEHKKGLFIAALNINGLRRHLD